MKTVNLSLTEEDVDTLMGVLVQELVKKYTTDPPPMTTAAEAEHAMRHHRRISVLIDKLEDNMELLNSKMR